MVFVFREKTADLSSIDLISETSVEIGTLVNACSINHKPISIIKAFDNIKYEQHDRASDPML